VYIYLSIAKRKRLGVRKDGFCYYITAWPESLFFVVQSAKILKTRLLRQLEIKIWEICENDPGKFQICDYGLDFSEFAKMTCVLHKDNVKQVNCFVYESILSSSRPLTHGRVGTSPRIVPKLGTIFTTVPLTRLDL